MSYDVYVSCHTCGSDLINHNNMTSNLAPMWDAAGAPLRDFNGLTAVDVIPRLQGALDRLRNDPERFQAMNPPNGWGCYEKCVEYLAGILAACCRDPRATVTVEW